MLLRIQYNFLSLTSRIDEAAIRASSGDLLDIDKILFDYFRFLTQILIMPI